MRGPLLGPPSQDGFPTFRTTLLCSLSANLATTIGETSSEARTASFWIERYSLTDISLTDFSTFSQFVSPFECDHETHAGCFLWQLFHVFAFNDDERKLFTLHHGHAHVVLHL